MANILNMSTYILEIAEFLLKEKDPFFDFEDMRNNPQNTPFFSAFLER